MNQKAQFELNPAAVILAIIGALVSFIVSKRVPDVGIMIPVLSAVIGFVACYFVALIIMNR